MAGFDLSIAAGRIYRYNPSWEGLWHENHGLFTFANDARTTYEVMIEFVTMAEDELGRAGITLIGPRSNDGQQDQGLKLRLKCVLSQPNSPFGTAIFLDYRSTSGIRDYVTNERLEDTAQRWTVTPNHVIRIKPWSIIIEAEQMTRLSTRHSMVTPAATDRISSAMPHAKASQADARFLSARSHCSAQRHVCARKHGKSKKDGDLCDRRPGQSMLPSPTAGLADRGSRPP